MSAARRTVVVVACAVALAAAVSSASAARASEPTGPPVPTVPTGPAPWHSGVTAAQAEAAQRDLDDGNRLLAAGLLAPGLAFYRHGLALWDHPAFHYNASKALMNLDRSDLALGELWLSLRYGAAPLGADCAGQISLLAKLVFEVELVHLVVVSERRETIRLGAIGAVGARDLLVGPGRWEGVVPLGEIALTTTAGKIELRREGPKGSRLEVVFPAAGEPSATVSEETADTRTELMRALLGFVVTDPTDAELAQAPRHPSRRVAPMPALVTPLERSAEARRLCRGASGALAGVCRSYDQDMTRLEARFRDDVKQLVAISRRLREMTSGGLVEILL